MKTTSELENVIQFHAQKYPGMEIQDMVKLIYQNEFGGGHLVKDAAASLAAIKSEMESADSGYSSEILESIGNNTKRVYLEPLKKLFPDTAFASDMLNQLFVKSSSIQSGSIPSYENKLIELINIFEENRLSASLNWPGGIKALREYIMGQKEKNYPLNSHSEKYRRLYKPSYRILLGEFAKFIDIFSEINILLAEKPPVIIGIDGKCGSGKTTLAEMISNVYAAPIIHMDDFFLPAELRTAERLDSPGGNVHYERFAEEVLNPLIRKEPFSYRVFDCSVMDYSHDRRYIEPNNIIIVEGSYSMRPELLSSYGIKVFLDLPESEQKRRIILRNGEEAFKQFEDRWIPMENKYFQHFNVPGNCDIII